MKHIIKIILLVFFTGSAFADTFYIGREKLNIPSPQGYALVTQKMHAIYRLGLKMDDPLNDQLAFYIAESNVPSAMAGETPTLERYYVLKVNKELKHLAISSKKFAELKTITKQQNENMVKTVMSQIPDHMENLSKGISKEFDVNVALKLTNMIPLDPHYETDNSISYSMYINYGFSVDGEKTDYIVSATVTYVNVRGKILFLYCYGLQKDLDWTRDASKGWLDMVVNSN